MSAIRCALLLLRHDVILPPTDEINTQTIVIFRLLSLKLHLSVNLDYPINPIES